MFIQNTQIRFFVQNNTQDNIFYSGLPKYGTLYPYNLINDEKRRWSESSGAGQKSDVQIYQDIELITPPMFNRVAYINNYELCYYLKLQYKLRRSEATLSIEFAKLGL